MEHRDQFPDPESPYTLEEQMGARDNRTRRRIRAWASDPVGEKFPIWNDHVVQIHSTDAYLNNKPIPKPGE
jgi:hypothetical protein